VATRPCGRHDRGRLRLTGPAEQESLADLVALSAVSTQNSLPSGSAITTQLTSPWPMSIRGAPQVIFGPSMTQNSLPSGTEGERSRHRLLLVLEGGARQIEVHSVLAGLRLPGGQKSDPESGVIARQKRAAVMGVVRHLPA
jgi:hypothetical protein